MTIPVSTVTDLRNLSAKRWAVIDMDTGTVLGTNLVLVALPSNQDEIEEMSSSDSAAFAYGIAHQHPIYTHADTTQD